MAEAPRLFVVAGEPSGDRLGADLVKRLRVLTQVSLSGVGGPELEGEGLASLYPMSNLSVMGTADVLARLPLLYWRMWQTVGRIRAGRPDLVVLIDSQVFSQTVATQLRKSGYAGKIVLYVAPSVWAWKPERAAILRPLFDEIFAILPFEPRVMRQLGGPPTVYVGHPALGRAASRERQPERGPLLLLPGSRAGELRRHLSLMLDVARALKDHPRVSSFILPTVKGQLGRVAAAVARWDVKVTVTAVADEKQAANAQAVAAVAVSGTVTLELALAGVPMVTTYVADASQMRAAQKYALRYAALPNILAERELVPEIIAETPQPSRVIAAVRALLDTPQAMDKQLRGFADIRALMRDGTPDNPPVDAARQVLSYLRASTAT